MKFGYTAKASLIGGIAGMLQYMLGVLFSFVFPKLPLSLDIVITGAFFILVGIGIIMSILISCPYLRDQKKSLIFSGIISSFLAGLFFYLGIGLYLGIVLFPALMAFIPKVFRKGRISFRMFLGGFVGGLIGSIISTLISGVILLSDTLSPMLKLTSISVLVPGFGIGIIIYFLNFGILLSLRSLSQEEVTP